MSRLRELFCDFTIVVFAFIIFFVAGCCSTKPATRGQTVNSRTFVELKRGISLAEMELLFQIKATHEFTFHRDDDTVRCVRYDLIGPAAAQTYYFVFTNDALALICLPQPREYGTRAENGNRIGFVIVQAEKTAEKVIHSEDMNGEALAKSVAQVTSLKRSKNAGSEPNNILPALIILSPLFIAAAPIGAVEKKLWWRDFETQCAKFDPFKVQLGMTVEEVKSMFGVPFGTDTSSDNLEIRYYGPMSFVEYTQPWVSIVFDHGKVVRVFSDQFFDSERKRELLRRKQAKP